MIDFSLPSKIGASYKKAQPFPNTIIDNFITDPEILRKSVSELKKYEKWGWDPGMDEMQVHKNFSPWCEENIYELESFCPVTFFLLNYLNSQPVLNYLSELTGIPDLIGDPTFTGGGVHKIRRGGQLAVHADYSFHRYTKLHRRINLLLYLNEGWKEEWGGNLELWEKDMKKCTTEIEPFFNRAVIFNITNIALHGHPEPLNCPEDEARYSLALYYFTKTRPQEELELNAREGDQTSVLWKESPSISNLRKKGVTVEQETPKTTDDIFKF